MTALTQDRITNTKDGKSIPVPAGTNVIFYQGGLVAVNNTTGLACPGKTAVGLTVIGVCDSPLNTTGLPDGSAIVLVRRGMLAQFNNLPADPVTQALFGRNCYIADDQTVAATSGGNTRSIAGLVLGIDAAGVWIQF
jgi:hypothetical protein